MTALDLEKHLKGDNDNSEKEKVKEIVVNDTAPVYERCVDAQGRSYATGKRKRAVVRVWLSEGKGKFLVNGLNSLKYFKRKTHQIVLDSPFVCVQRLKKFDVVATATGGGVKGQAEALRLGIARALVLFDPSCRESLKAEGFLRRDSRVVERKKYGQKKARKRFQFSKR